MKKLIFLFIVLLAAVWLGVLMHQHPGYVLISVGHTQIETTIWFALIALLLVWLILRFLLGLLRGTFQLSRRYRDWSALHNERKSQQLSQQGFCNLIEEKWTQAEESFKEASKKNPEHFVNYMGAARAAQMQKAYARRDNYLQQAKQKAGKSTSTSIGIAEAYWQLAADQPQAALTTLQELQKNAGRNPVVLRELQQAYYRLGQWENLRGLLPSLQRHNAVDPAVLAELEKEVFTALLQQASLSHNADAAEKIWDDLPKTLQKDPAMLAIYTQHLLAQKKSDEAESLLKHQLRKSLNRQLLLDYAQINSANPARQLARAEEWLVAHPNNADLLYCLGELCVQHRLWGKARSYLEKSISLQPRPESYQLLGRVLENLGDQKAALACYHSALAL